MKPILAADRTAPQEEANHPFNLQLLETLAQEGDTRAQFNLGGLYYEGQGVPNDLVRASVWFTLAAIAGYDGASRNRNSVATLLTADQISTVHQMARACRLNNYVECD